MKYMGHHEKHCWLKRKDETRNVEHTGKDIESNGKPSDPSKQGNENKDETKAETKQRKDGKQYPKTRRMIKSKIQKKTFLI